MQHEEWICYQRIIMAGDDRQVRLMVATGPSVISISTSVFDHALVVVTIDGKYGADLLVALSSVYTAATQGGSAMVKIDKAALVSFRKDSEAIEIDDGLCSVEIPLDMAERSIRALQILLNDVTGEYRRQVDELEKAT